MGRQDMDRADFNAAIAQIYAAFNLDAPPAQTVNAWYDVAGHFPSGEAAAWCVRQFIAGKSRLYRGDNVSRDLAELYEDYKRQREVEHYRQQAAHGMTCCPECDPRIPGFVLVQTRMGKISYRWLYRCRCNHDPRFARVPLYPSSAEDA